VLTQAGHVVCLAGDGQQAVDRVAHETFDIVLMDVSMPRLDGIAATRAIRSREAGTGRRLPIIALTANSLDEDRQQCLAAGMDGFLVKPLEQLTLAEAISLHCGAPARA
jgi:CheY-like chemotaxis protein